MSEPVCYCGHVRDEHCHGEDRGGTECTIEECKCVMFECDVEASGFADSGGSEHG